MRIGILGGTFDPIHESHINLAKAAVSELSLDKVIFIPAGNPYFKSGKRSITLPIHRYNMIKLAIAPYPYMELSDIELHSKEETYTADTLTKLNKSHKSDEFFFIVGSDSLNQMDTWYKPQTIFDLATIVVGNRDGIGLSNQIKKLQDVYNAEIFVLSDKYWKPNNLSSSNIRIDIEGSSCNVCSRVMDYIKHTGLYSDNLTISQIKERLKIELKKSRFEHTLNVADVSYDLALVHGYNDPDKAYLAGLLHDVGKPYAGALEHASKGAEIAHKYYNITDEEVLNAISSHTVGRCNMSLLEKIVFIADFIEPSRTFFEGIEEIRALAYIDIDKAIVKSILSTIDYLNMRGERVDDKTLEVYNYYNKYNL